MMIFDVYKDCSHVPYIKMRESSFLCGVSAAALDRSAPLLTRVLTLTGLRQHLGVLLNLHYIHSVDYTSWKLTKKDD